MRFVRFDVEDDRMSRAAWSRLAEPGDDDAHRKVALMGAGPALREVIDGAGDCERWQVRLPDLDPARDVATLGRFGGRLLVPQDEEWPAGLADLGPREPYCLWVRGPLELGAPRRGSVAVVGSRAATPYGERVAADLGAGCGQRGLTVVSGGAYGIDGAAHRGALTAAGATVAVLACGVDRYYPRGHEQLLRRIADEGAVVSEVPPGSSPTRWRFLERNRLIAALARATVVVEAAWRSGALSTAREARELNRLVGAVPGPVTSPASAGCHRLLRDGLAECVTDAAEVAELAGPIGEHLEPEKTSSRVADHDGLGPDDIRVLDALPLRTPASLLSVTRTAGLTERTVSAALGRLSLAGLARLDAVGWVRAPRPR